MLLSKYMLVFPNMEKYVGKGFDCHARRQEVNVNSILCKGGSTLALKRRDECHQIKIRVSVTLRKGKGPPNVYLKKSFQASDKENVIDRGIDILLKQIF